MDRLLELSLVDAARLLAQRELSPVELTEAYLERIEQTEPELNAYVTVAAAAARASAQAAADEIAAHGSRGVLHGIPIGVKDIIDTAGLRTTYGSALYADHVPETDAAVVADLNRAGAVLLGKQATQEFAWGGRTDSPAFGPTHNPYDAARIPGGSSGGAAASLVAHSCLGAIGTDTAGSVRIPAALSGCVGFKPTRGSISLDGVLPLAFTLDHVGVLARSVADATALLAALTPRPDVGTEAVEHVDGASLRFGWLRGWPESSLAPDVHATLETARSTLRDAGATVVDIDLPEIPGLNACLQDVVLSQARAVHRRNFETRPDAFGSDVAGLLSRRPPSRDRLAECELTLSRAATDLLAALSRCDVLLGATEPVTAPRIGELDIDLGGTTLGIETVLTMLTAPANVLGNPALSLPAGMAAGLPVGLHLSGRRCDDTAVLAAGRFAESVLDTLPRPDR